MPFQAYGTTPDAVARMDIANQQLAAQREAQAMSAMARFGALMDQRRQSGGVDRRFYDELNMRSRESASERNLRRALLDEQISGRKDYYGELRQSREEIAEENRQQRDDATKLNLERSAFGDIMDQAESGMLGAEDVLSLSNSFTSPQIKTSLKSLATGIRRNEQKLNDSAQRIADALNIQTKTERDAWTAAKEDEAEPLGRGYKIPFTQKNLPSFLTTDASEAAARKAVTDHTFRTLLDKVGSLISDKSLGPEVLSLIEVDPSTGLIRSGLRSKATSDSAPRPPMSAPPLGPGVTNLPPVIAPPASLNPALQMPGTVVGQPLDLSGIERAEVQRIANQLLSMRDELGRQIHTRESALNAAMNRVVGGKLIGIPGGY